MSDSGIQKYLDSLIWTINEHAQGNLTKEGTTMCDYCAVGTEIKEEKAEPHSKETCEECLWHPKYATEEGMKYLRGLKETAQALELLGETFEDK